MWNMYCQIRNVICVQIVVVMWSLWFVVRSRSCEWVQQPHCHGYHSFQFHSQPREKFCSLLSAPTEFQFRINHFVRRDAFSITEPNGEGVFEGGKGSTLLTTGSGDGAAFIREPPLGAVPSCRALSGCCRPPYRSWIFLLRLQSECRSNKQPPLSPPHCYSSKGSSQSPGELSCKVDPQMRRISISILVKKETDSTVSLSFDLFDVVMWPTVRDV